MTTFLIGIIIWQYLVNKPRVRVQQIKPNNKPLPKEKQTKKPTKQEEIGWVPYSEEFYIELPYRIKDPFLKDIGWNSNTNTDRKRRAKLWNHELNVHGVVTCSYCEKLLTFNKTFTVDHIIPRSISKNHSLENLTPACHECNNKKGNKILTR